MGYRKASPDDVESAAPEEFGGLWFLRDALGAENLGVSIAEIAPGASGMEHDHTEEGHEEVYCVVEGEVAVDLGDETVTVGENEAIRVDPGQSRQLHNRTDEPARLVIAGAP